MNYNSATGLYEAIIPRQLQAAHVRYKIIACDYAENIAEQDNDGVYYVYTVIPEFSTRIILLVFASTTTITVIIIRRYAKKTKFLIFLS